MATFRKRGSKWEYRISYKDPFTAKNKLKSKSGYDTKKEAQLAAAEMEQALMNGLENDSVPLALSNYLRDWLNNFKEGVVRKNTYEIHHRNIENHIIPYFKSIDIKGVKPIMYQKFINHLCDQDYSKRTVEIIHGTMYNAMEKAIILGKVTKNPCRGIEIKTKKKRSSDELEYIDSKKLPEFFKVSYQYGYIYYIFFKTLIDTGMRKGEAAALQWSDIDLKERKININKTLDFQAKNRNELFGDPKTFTSKRTIKISKSLTRDLHEHKKKQNEDKLILNDIYDHELNLVFARQDGSPLPKSSLFNAFERILKQADIPKVPIHATRHTHAVLLLESGASMKYIQDRLGHKSMQITSDVYSHISDKIENSSIDKYEEHLESIYN